MTEEITDEIPWLILLSQFVSEISFFSNYLNKRVHFHIFQSNYAFVWNMCNQVFNDVINDFILWCLYCSFFDNVMVKFLIMIKFISSNPEINETTQKCMPFICKFLTKVGQSKYSMCPMYDGLNINSTCKLTCIFSILNKASYKV